MIGKIIAVVAICIACIVGGYFKGVADTDANWAPIVANLDSELEGLKKRSADRERNEKEAAKRVVANKRTEELKREAEREIWSRQLRAEWSAHLDERVRAATAGAAAGEAALSTCRAENAALRAGLERVLTAGEHARKACDASVVHLDALLEWTNNATR